MIYYEDSWDGWTKGNRKNLRAREGYLYPGGIWPDIRRNHLQRSNKSSGAFIEDGNGTELQQTCGRDRTDERICTEDRVPGKGRFWNLLRDTIGCTDYPGYPTQYYESLDMREESIEGMFRIQDRQKINRIRDEHGGNRMVRWMQYSDETGQKISKETVQWMIKMR